MRKILLSLLIGGGVCLSCVKENVLSDCVTGDNSVTFRTHLSDTRATESSFENGDAVSIFATDDYYGELGYDNYSDNSQYVYSSGEFRPAGSDDSIAYPDEYTSLHFYAVWPYSASYTGYELDFSVSQDQSTSESYAYSNLMLARTDETRAETVDLYFEHLMCKVVINIHSDNFPAGERICFFNNVYKDATINLNDGGVSTTGDQTYVYGSLNGTNSFKVLLPPQSIPAGTQFFIFQIGEKSWQWKPSKTLILASGVEYEYDLSI